MLTQKFLIFGRPLPWAFFKSNSTNGTQTFDFEKASLLMRVAMKLHNACIDDRIEETWVLSDLTGHYETSAGQANGRARGYAETRPTMASEWAHPNGGSVPSWTDEDAASQMPPPHVHKSAPAKRKAQLEKVSAARVHITETLAQLGLDRPDPAAVSANVRAAKRARHQGA
jgi:hypothetical protein|tara:strand:+ start:1740 stop:2252 length:513 start_codon:yes stop_codon:yes gene_type:complete